MRLVPPVELPLLLVVLVLVVIGGVVGNDVGCYAFCVVCACAVVESFCVVTVGPYTTWF